MNMTLAHPNNKGKVMNRLIQAMLIFLLVATFNFSVVATDRAKEKRWASHINDFLLDGTVEWLDANHEKFLSIYTPTNKPPIGAVILLHGRGMHPDWPQVIQPLRTQLPSRGWSTLSLQMPVLQTEASDEDYLPIFNEVPARIQAGLDFLSSKGLNNIILVGHSLGSNMATNYLVKHHDPRIKAFVGIGMMGKLQPPETALLDNIASILQMQIPVLDVYGSNSFPAILASADRRAFAIASYQADIRTRHSRIVEIKEANHFFQGHEDELLGVIVNWLDKLTVAKQTNQIISTKNHLNSK